VGGSVREGYTAEQHDDASGWMRELSLLIDRFGSNTVVDEDFSFAGRFGETERLTVAWTRPTSGERLVELLASRSYLIVAAEQERQELFAAVRDLVATHPDLARRESFEMPI
jgi:hypothetical protein